jgi:hypothetical protein
MNILAKTLPAIAAGALLATSALAQSVASLVARVGPEGFLLTAQSVTLKSPGK